MKNKQAQSLGKLGGKATARKGKEYMAELGKAGAKKRWAKKECPMKGRGAQCTTKGECIHLKK